MKTDTLFSHENPITVVVPKTLQNTPRIDKLLSESFRNYSRTFFAQVIANGGISVNGSTVTKPSMPIQAGDTIIITVPPAPSPDTHKTHPLFKEIKIIHETEHFLIINKPIGLIVHKTSAASTLPTLTDWLVEQYEKIAHVGYIDRPGIVHRLDKDTSGVMIIARTNYAHSVFTNLFKKREIEKTYHGLVHGCPEKNGMIDFPIARHPVHRKKMMAIKKTNETGAGTVRHARTYYSVLQYFETRALVEFKPVTGRTHQIRVHTAAIGHSLVGDSVYTNKHDEKNKVHILHAQRIAFIFNEQKYSFDADYSPLFTDTLAQLKKP